MAMSPARLHVRRIKVAIFVLCSTPLAWLGVNALRGHLTSNPIEAVLNRLGYWALVMLLGSLACTPLKLVLGWTWPLQVRRMVGLFAFFYATAHLSVYLGLDKGFDFRDVLEDIFKRKFITLGMLTWLMLAPLALTSTNGWTRRLGFKRWKRLHRLAYVAGATGCIHFLLRGKVIFLEPVLFTTALVVLLVARLLSALRTRRAISSVQEV